MGALDKLFSVATELARKAPQAMPLSQWQKYMQPGRVLERGGVRFPLRQDELKYGPIARILDPAQRPAGAMVRGQETWTPKEFTGALERMDPAVEFKTFAPRSRYGEGDISGRSMHYEGQYQLPGEKLGQSEELTLLPGSDFQASTGHFGGQRGLLSWHRATRRPVSGAITKQDYEPLSTREFRRFGNLEIMRHEGRLNDRQTTELAVLEGRRNKRAADSVILKSGDTAYHIEEIQSDWHQRGREEGYISPEVQVRRGYGASGVPFAPYEKTYAELELKKGIANAVHNGDSYVTWTTGDQQADRWGQALRNSVDEIKWYKNPDGTYNVAPMKEGRGIGVDERFEKLNDNQLEDLLGVDIAKKVTSGEGKYAANPLLKEEHERLNSNLRVHERNMGRLAVVRDEIKLLHNIEDSGKYLSASDANHLDELFNEEERISRYLADTKPYSSALWKRFERHGTEENPREVNEGVISGDNLTVGGSGMRLFYDRKVPEAARKLAAQYGGEVTKVKLPGVKEDYYIPSDVRDSINEIGDSSDIDELHNNLDMILSHFAGGNAEGAPRDLDEAGHAVLGAWETDRFNDAVNEFIIKIKNHASDQTKQQEVWAIKITPEMRKKVLEAGLPLFSAGALAGAGTGLYGETGEPVQGFGGGGKVRALVTAAIKALDDSKIYVGSDHLMAFDDYLLDRHGITLDQLTDDEMNRRIDDFYSSGNFEFGFMDEAGKFLNRKQALSAAKKSGQYTESGELHEPGKLHASDLEEELGEEGYASGGVVKKLGKIITAAIRDPETLKIYRGLNHSDALLNGLDDLAPSYDVQTDDDFDDLLERLYDQVEYGFIDEHGQFLDRTEAMDAAKATGQLPRDFPEKYLGHEDLHATDVFTGLDPLKKAEGGLVTLGNIDLTNRPKVRNPDGSYSTVRSMSFEDNGQEVLVPTVSDDGRILTNAEAIDLYRRTGRHLGIFTDPESATAYAKKLHQEQEESYGYADGGPVGSFPMLPTEEDVTLAQMMARRRAVNDFVKQIYADDDLRQNLVEAQDAADIGNYTHLTSSGQGAPQDVPDLHDPANWPQVGLGPYDTKVTDWLQQNVPTGPAESLNDLAAALSFLLGSSYAETAQDPEANFIDKQTALAADLLTGMTATGGLTRAMQKPTYELMRQVPGALAKAAPLAAAGTAAASLYGDRPAASSKQGRTLEELIAGYGKGGVVKGGPISILDRLPAEARPYHEALYADPFAGAPETGLPSRSPPPAMSIARPMDSRTETPSDAGRSARPAPFLAPYMLPVPPKDSVTPGNSFDGFFKNLWESAMNYLSPAARSLILDAEGMNQPSAWPGGQSGITLGRGYDLGHHSLEEFKRDWGPYLTPEQIGQLSKGVGKTGLDAAAVAPMFKGIHVPEKVADEVFDKISAPKYIGQARRAFPGFDALPSDAQGALVSLVYNRGPEVGGERRKEMAAIYDILKDGVQEGDLDKIATQIRSMKRLWEGKGLSGLLRRRDREADLVLTAKS